MADIELVIKMPEEIYKYVRGELAESECHYDYNLTSWNVIHNGTPLPKWHGRLIDADWVLNKMSTTDAQPTTPNEHYAWDFAKTLFRNAPTIIEADKEQSNENDKTKS